MPSSSRCRDRRSPAGKASDASAAARPRPAVARTIHASRNPLAHRDPFDRMLAAQAEIERLTLVTSDQAFAAFGVETLW
jgi:PIN domain nuclease of toxin-antitoxin system